MQEALDYINKSICTLLALQCVQDEQVIKNLHILQKAVDKANKYDELLSVLKEYNVDLSNIREILVAGNMAQDWRAKANKYDEKETPKKPIENPFERNKHFKVCPNCWEKDIKTFVYGKYCDECGQRLE